MVIYASVCGLSLLLELINARRSNSIKGLLTKYVIYLWLSIGLFFAIIAWQKLFAEHVLARLVGNLCLGITSSFSLAAYLLFRGIFVLFTISGEEQEHPTCLAVDRLTRRPMIAYCLLVAITILGSAGPIYALLVYLSIDVG